MERTTSTTEHYCSTNGNTVGEKYSSTSFCGEFIHPKNLLDGTVINAADFYWHFYKNKFRLFDRQNNLYVTDRSNHWIEKFNYVESDWNWWGWTDSEFLLE